MIKEANDSNGGLRAGRVVVNLTREELEFVDKIGRDALFTTGKRLTNNRIIRAFINVMMTLKIRGDGLYTDEELKNRILVELGVYKEKRGYPRFRKEVTLSWRKASSNDKFEEGSTVDMGEGGFRIELKEDRKVGENFEFSIKDSSEPYSPITVFGRITWIKRRDEDGALEAGIKLTRIPDRDRPRFSKLLYEEFCPGFFDHKKENTSK